MGLCTAVTLGWLAGRAAAEQAKEARLFCKKK
jgi:hypothetical protein